MNNVILMGRLVKDPELRHTASNIPVSSFTLAVDRSYTNKDGQRETDFINIVAWRGTAEFTSRYFKKGMRVAINGRIQTRSWDDKEGRRRYTTEVVAREAYFADSKKDFSNTNNNSFDTNENSDISKDVEGFMPIEADDDLPF